jgi:hypothetical protein
MAVRFCPGLQNRNHLRNRLDYNRFNGSISRNIRLAKRAQQQKAIANQLLLSLYSSQPRTEKIEAIELTNQSPFNKTIY